MSYIHYLKNPAVVEFANEVGLWPDEASMLDRLVFRGKKIETSEQARVIYGLVKLACRSDEGPPRYEVRINAPGVPK